MAQVKDVADIVQGIPFAQRDKGIGLLVLAVAVPDQLFHVLHRRLGGHDGEEPGFHSRHLVNEFELCVFPDLVARGLIYNSNILPVRVLLSVGNSRIVNTPHQIDTDILVVYICNANGQISCVCPLFGGHSYLKVLALCFSCSDNLRKNTFWRCRIVINAETWQTASHFIAFCL